MASTYPTSLDSFTNPSASSLLTSPSHAQQHSDINDAMEAVQTKLAIGNTVIGTYTAYTPTFLNVTIGNGTVSGAYAQVNDFIHVYGSLTFGSTTAFTSIVSLDLPVNIATDQAVDTMGFGLIQCRDVSTGLFYVGGNRHNGSASSVFLGSFGANIGNAYLNILTSTVPFTWATTDVLTWNLYYRGA
jgi:hypothetical protein